MQIPGSNLLSLANRLIAQQILQYAQYQTRAVNSVGVWNTTYNQPVQILGNIQPVPRQRYENMGLDFQKNYAIIYVQKNVIDIDRNVAGDQFTYNGIIYEAISKTNWFAQDDWVGVLCVAVPQ